MTTESGYDDKAYDARMNELCASLSDRCSADRFAASCQLSNELWCCAFRNSDDNAFFKEWTESVDSFDQMGLHESLLRGIYAYGASLRPRPRRTSPY